MSETSKKLRVGVFKFASCDGCQLSLLNCEDELLELAGAVDIGYFLEASSRPLEGDFDLSLVEGSISAPEQIEQIHDVRRRSRILITIGACATAGGVQALRNFAKVEDFLQAVYARPDYIQTLEKSTPIAEHVAVDYELRGCPINARQLLGVISALLFGRRPNLPNHSVCVECKRSGTVCVMVAQGAACLGPVTQAGCGAICTSYNRGCFGCFGPSKGMNLMSLISEFDRRGIPRQTSQRLLHTYNAWSPAWRMELPLVPSQ